MIAITLNLLAEEQQAQEARARDPVKLFTAIGLAAVTLAVALGGTLSAVLMQRRAELDGLQAQWNKMNEVGVGEGEFQKVNACAQEIVTLNHSRILMAPQLALVKDLIPPTIQLLQIGLSLTVEGSEEGGDTKHARPKQAGRLALRLDGVAFSRRPELEVDQFLNTLRNDARFNALVEDIQLRSISRSSSDADNTGHATTSAIFVIECRYKEAAAQ